MHVLKGKYVISSDDEKAVSEKHREAKKTMEYKQGIKNEAESGKSGLVQKRQDHL